MERVYECKEECCGCSACYNICPVNAITMQPDEKGFLYPVIDKEKCINCKRCQKVCPFRKERIKNNDIEVFAIKNSNNKIRKESSSGGIFYELCKYVINQKGYIYGAAFDNNFKVIHEGANNLEDCKKFMGSKYVQSNIKNIYKEINEKLKETIVLFSGTPCQVQGLKNYLGKENENLITVDIVCHGVPSPQIFEDYKNYQQKVFNSKIKDIKFRYKTENVFQNMYIEFENEKVYICPSRDDKYYKLFDIDLRESCYNCKFSNTNRVGDITLGDFWKVEKVIEGFDDNKGVSLVILNTDKGREIFKEIKQNLIVNQVNIEQALQPNLIRPTSKDKRYNKFWIDYNKKGFEYVKEKYSKRSFVKKVKIKIINKIKKLREGHK